MYDYIVVSHLTCLYGRVVALDDVSVDIPLGNVTALTGPNGSGKSTLLEVLAGTLVPKKGVIEGLPSSVAYVPQRSQVPDQLPITVRRCVEMGSWSKRSKSDANLIDIVLEQLQIANLQNRLIGELSGGQRQRTLIAQGLVQQANLLLLDEPLAGIDKTTSELISTVIEQERARGTTIVMATHDPVQAEQSDRVLLLEHGRLSAWEGVEENR